MDQAGTVLAVTSNVEAWSAPLGVLSDQHDCRVLLARSPAEALAALSNAHVDLVIAEDGRDGVGLLSGLRISHPDIVRILVVEANSQLSRQAVSPAAIYQFVREPLDAEQVGLLVKRALETRELARRHRLLSREFKVPGHSGLPNGRNNIAMREGQRFEKLVYVSEKMAALCDLARKAARTELPILIRGESGTGKELLARAIHYNSPRRSRPLIVQNCGLPDELLQSKVFGHKRGAFTGAIADRLGVFHAADGGTVFLDEISEVSPAFQVSLLHFLQDRVVKPLGSDRTETCNVRIIAASSRPLSALVAVGRFRQDLFFRLRGFEFEMPPLRDRPDDIPALAEFLAARHADAIGRKTLGISASALERLMAFDFPGNVRELDNEIRRMVSLTNDGEYLTTQTMSPTLLAATPRKHAGHSRFSPEGVTLKDQVESLEKQIVIEALARHRWNQSRAADELGLSRVGLANKIRRYGLDRAAAG